MSIDEAVLMLQRHERARQGRLRAKLMLEIRRQENAEKNKGRTILSIVYYIFISLKCILFGNLFMHYSFAGKTIQNMSVAMAATKIQNLWKGAIARRQVKKQREEELAFIGMVIPLNSELR